jgi:hypothetical protein
VFRHQGKDIMQMSSIERRVAVPGRAMILTAAVLVTGCGDEPAPAVDAAQPVDAALPVDAAQPVDAALPDAAPGLSLASVVVSGIAPVVTLAPGTTEYVVELPLSQPAVTLTATVAHAGDTLTIAGTPVASGTPSQEIALDLGDNLVDIVVENDIGEQRTYRLTLRRAAALAQYAYGKASNTGIEDHFGWSVALSGDTLAVGAYLEDSAARGVNGNQDDGSAQDSGAVYVFRRTGAAWQQEAYLKASNNGALDQFGYALALSGDTLAVGAVDEDSATRGVNGNQDDDSATSSGAVYVFRRNDATWQQEAYLKASNTTALDAFGVSLALSGNTLAVGSHEEDSVARGVNGDQDDDSASNSGAVYVFRRTGTAWQQEAYLKASNTGAQDHFGISMALSGDTLAVGAYLEDSAARGVDGDQEDDAAQGSGAVYVFRHDGAAWQQEAYLKASNTSAGDNFGGASGVALSGDTLAVGAYQEDSATQEDQDDNSAGNSGAVYVFRRTGAAWQHEAYLKASSPAAGDFFGVGVALSGDTLAVGSYQDDDVVPNSGAVHVFRRSGTAWPQGDLLKASNPGNFDFFGFAVALSGDTLAVGAANEGSSTQGVNGNQADDGALQSGAVYILH